MKIWQREKSAGQRSKKSSRTTDIRIWEGRLIHILGVNQFYWPDVAATGQLLQDLCEDLSARGHTVTVLAGRAGYAGTEKLPREDAHGGVAIVRRGPSGANRTSAMARLWGYLSFYASAFSAMLALPKPDVLFVESTPPLIIVGAAVASRLRSVPLIHVVQDLYPEAAEALGALRHGGFIAGLLRRMHRWALRRADRVIVLGRDMAARIEQTYSVPSNKIAVIPNWADLDSLRHTPEDVARLKESWGLTRKRVVMYSGNLGRAHLFGEVLDLAERWRDRTDIAILCVGSGQGWDAVAAERGRRGLSNILLKPYQDRAALGASLACGDMHLITQRPETLGLIVPSKLYGIMAVERPTVFVGPATSEVALTLSEIGAGSVVAPGDVDGLECALLQYLYDPAAAARAGQAGRNYMESDGNRRFRTAQYAEIIEEVAGVKTLTVDG
jgi:colanic acid biosynthesis glycosyl transferase WcaI